MGLLSIVPLPYRILAYAGLLASAGVYGYWKGAAHGHEQMQLDADAREKAILQVQLKGANDHAALIQQSKDRADTLAKDLDSARALSAGLSVRLETILRRAAPTRPSTSSGDGLRGDTGDALATELYRRQQLVFDAAAKCGAQEASLMSRPICECAKP